MTLALLSADQLRVCPLFQSLDASDLQLLLERQRRTLIGVDQLLVQEHDWGETIFFNSRWFSQGALFQSGWRGGGVVDTWPRRSFWRDGPDR
jgi:hypothetical protein